MSRHPRVELIPLGDPARFNSVQFSAENLTLRQLLERAPAVSRQPIAAELMDRPLDDLMIDPQLMDLHCPPGMRIGWDGETPVPTPAETKEPPPGAESPETPEPETERVLNEAVAVRLSYAREIEKAASFLRAGLSVLILCDKICVEHLWQDMVRKGGLEALVLEVPQEEGGGGLMPRSTRQRQFEQLKEYLKDLKKGDVLVIPHLDLLAGGAENNLSNEARELTELLYKASDRLLLAFADPSLAVPEVLSARFAVRLLVSGLPRSAPYPDGSEKSLGEALIATEEKARFVNFDPEGLYKNVAGMNPVQFRHAITYVIKEYAQHEPIPAEELYHAIRAFKAQTSANFEVPDVTFNDIGGYQQVKDTLERALSLMAGAYNLPDDKLRGELIPRGFIFHGPPGTGKTLFAKAIANQLNATVLVVSGPEVTDMYVGESERKLRELFAEARRNAPSVLVFDEFDALAAKRSGREDGGSRAGNAIVAQMLTEMDGFRPDVPMLVIGTTNRLDIVDEALLRPSRFQPVHIGLPERGARQAIAAVHAKHFHIEVGATLLEVIAEFTEGFNGDEIRSLFRDSCVGQYCEAKTVDARYLGELVGRIRQTKEQRATSASQTPPPTRPGERHRVDREAFIPVDTTTPEPAPDPQATEPKQGPSDPAAMQPIA